jgi:hypothetical protein
MSVDKCNEGAGGKEGKEEEEIPQTRYTGGCPLCEPRVHDFSKKTNRSINNSVAQP